MRTRARGSKAAEAPALDEELTDTQRRILTAALDVFAEKGFAGASTAEIAARAGVAEKTLFAQYGSKQSLLMKTLEPSTLSVLEPQMISGLQEALKPGRSLRELLTAFMRDRIGMAQRHPKRIKLVIQEAMLHPELRASMQKKFAHTIAPLLLPAFADLQARGELRSDLPLRTIMRTLASTTFGLSVAKFVLELEPESDVNTEIDLIVELLVNGLGGGAAPLSKPKSKASARRRRQKS